MPERKRFSPEDDLQKTTELHRERAKRLERAKAIVGENATDEDVDIAALDNDADELLVQLEKEAKKK